MSVFSNIDNNDKNSNEKFIFYNSIGSPKLIVAPMVDQSELPYRMMTRKYGANLVFTQMFNANSFISSKGIIITIIFIINITIITVIINTIIITIIIINSIIKTQRISNRKFHNMPRRSSIDSAIRWS
jgi:membrane-associated HD superfamily phosphohydrolase